MDAPFLAEDATLRTITAHLRRISEMSRPPPQAELTDARWQLFCAILDLFALKGRLVYPRLARHPDPQIAARAEEYAALNEAMYDMFATRSDPWAPDAVEAEWPRFSASLRQLTDVIDHRLAVERRELLPYLEGAPPANGESLPERDWAAEAVRLRARLYQITPEGQR